MSKLVMGYWDCPYCETKGIRGDMAACPSCGRPRGAVKFYLKDHAEEHEHLAGQPADVEYVDEEKAKYVNRNPDWYCSFCETLNSDNADTCRSCGASRADSEANYFQIHEQMKAREAAARPLQAQAPVRKKSRLPLILIACVLIIAGLFYYMSQDVTKGGYQVSEISWERVVDIERNTLLHESGWIVPAGGQITGQRQEIHHYEQVLAGYRDVEVQRSRRVIDHYETYYTYEDLGNGMFSQVEHERPVYGTEYYTETESQPYYRSEPRYQTLYEYDIWRWQSVRQATARGTDHNAYWPDPQLGENEREGERQEVYRVVITDENGRAARYRMNEADWRHLSPGDSLYLTAQRSGGNPHISDENGNPLYELWREQ